MYQNKHLTIASKFTSDKCPNVAFYGNKIVATDTYRLIELLNDAPAHELVQYPSAMLKAVKIGKNETKKHEDFGLRADDVSKFPEYETLLPRFTEGEFIEFTVNGEFLAEIAKEFSKLAKTKSIRLKVPKVWADKKAHETGRTIIIEAGNFLGSTAPEGTAYLMPAKSK